MATQKKNGKRLILPSTVLICGKTFAIIKDRAVAGAKFSTNYQEIRINTTYLPERVYELILHEILEAIFAERDMRYAMQKEDVTNGDYLFCFRHKEFENAMRDFSTAVREIKWTK